jgi:hypothetical protein
MDTRLAVAVIAVLLVAGPARTASAQGPSDKSQLQSAYINVVGSTNGLPDNCSDGHCGAFTATIRDFANNALAGVVVSIDFSGCPDIQISCDQLTAATGQTYLGNKRVAGMTNAAGQFTFHVQGAASATPMAGNVTSAGTNAGVPCAQFWADDVPLTPALVVSAFDVNGIGTPGAGVSGADVSLVASEVAKVPLGAQARARDDYNHSNQVSGADVAIASHMAAEASLGTGSQNTGPYCP